MACIKDPKGLQGTSGVGINDEIITVRNDIRERARKIAHNSAVKMKTTTGREMNTPKSGKTAAQPTRLGPISGDGNR